MKIKSTINFKALRDKGPSSLDIKEDEVVQITTKNEILCVVRQEFLNELINSVNKAKANHIQSSALINSTLMDRKVFTNSQLVGSAISIKAEKTVEERVTELERQLKKLINEKE